MHLETLIAVGVLTALLGLVLFLLHFLLMWRWRRKKPDDPQLRTHVTTPLVVTAVIGITLAIGLLAVGLTGSDGFLARVTNTIPGRYGVVLLSFIVPFGVAHLLGFKPIVRGPKGDGEDAS